MRIAGWRVAGGICAVALGSLWTARSAAQQPAFRSSVNTVAVYATVNDSSGRLVPNLVREDFQILDKGVPAEITTFSNDPQPITVLIMLDMSWSMRSRLLRLRDSTLKFIQALGPGDRAQIGTFGEEIAISPLLTDDKATLARVLREELWPNGGTPLWTALDAAMTALAGETGRRVVLAITDGEDVCNLPRCVGAGRIEDRAERESFMLYAIGMDGTGLAGRITELTERTGGGHFALAPGADLASTFALVADELRHQYLLGFTPARMDGGVHRLEVRVTRPGLTVRARKNYVAAASR
jgi:Ca-activated chloride channel family protein